MYSFNRYFDNCVVKTINKIVVQLKRTFQNNSDELITDERLVIYFGTCSIPKKQRYSSTKMYTLVLVHAA
jgi:hypothetical protein